jgi:DNA-binding HxlR family transcriptional regulator
MRRRFTHHNCSIAQSLEVLGDWWTLLLIREAFLGTRRFAEFASTLGISKNILTRRLGHLVDHGVMERVDAGVHGRRYEYVLTPMGKDLATMLTALRQWGDRWIFGRGHEPLVIQDRRTGRPIPPVRIRGEDGEPIAGDQLEIRPGPGASRKTRARCERLARDAARAG